MGGVGGEWCEVKGRIRGKHRGRESVRDGKHILGWDVKGRRGGGGF